MELPYRFPDPLEASRRRSRAYQQLPVEERLRQLGDVIAAGLLLLRESPQREIGDRVFQQREDEWKRIQKELFRRHGA